MDQELKNRLEAGLEDMAPMLVPQILEQEICPIASEAELFGEPSESGSVIQMPPKGKRAWKRLYSAVAGMAAAIALLLGVYTVQEGRVIEGQIIVDVNPSVSLAVNKWGRVQKVEALNADGVSIVDGLSRRTGSVESVLDSLFDSLEQNDYLKGEQAGVLVSYCYVQESADVEAKIQSTIATQSSNRQNCTIFSQTFEKEDEEEERAKTAGVSVGKYYFVNRIREGVLAREGLSYDNTMEEIVQIMGDQVVEVAGVEVYSGGNVPESSDKSKASNTEDADVSVQTTELASESSTSSDLAKNETQGTQGTESAAGSTQAPASTQAPGAQPGSGGSAATGTGITEPGTPQPGTVVPGTEEPGTEVPDTEEPGTEEPGTEQPSIDVSMLLPGWVTAECDEDKKVYLAWEDLEDAAGYDIYYRSTGRQDYEKIVEGVSGTSCVISGLSPGRSYIFRVVPYVTAGGEKYYGTSKDSPVVGIPMDIDEWPDETEEPETQDAREEETQAVPESTEHGMMSKE